LEDLLLSSGSSWGWLLFGSSVHVVQPSGHTPYLRQHGLDLESRAPDPDFLVAILNVSLLALCDTLGELFKKKKITLCLSFPICKIMVIISTV
jgi:hypothetical protein